MKNESTFRRRRCPLSVGERIANRRREIGLTQAQLAKKAGLKSAGAISNYESGIRSNPRQLINIANALGVSAQWLQTGRELDSTLPNFYWDLSRENREKADSFIQFLLANQTGE